MKIIFLDIDGVLNAHEPLCPHVMSGTIRTDKAALLKQVLLQTGAQIVLSSAWRYLVFRGEMNLVGLNWLFRTHGIPGVIIDITNADTLLGAKLEWTGTRSWPVADERGAQITHWLSGHQHILDGDKYVVLDDTDLGISASGHPFVKTDPNTGLTEADAQRVLEILA